MKLEVNRKEIEIMISALTDYIELLVETAEECIEGDESGAKGNLTVQSIVYGYFTNITSGIYLLEKLVETEKKASSISYSAEIIKEYKDTLHHLNDLVKDIQTGKNDSKQENS